MSCCVTSSLLLSRSKKIETACFAFPTSNTFLSVLTLFYLSKPKSSRREPALSLGVAFQITNILRDVGEDATTRGRVYLPTEDMERFGVTKEQLLEQRVDQNYINLMKFEIARARMYYERARRGVFMLAEESRLPVQSALDAYGKILDKIEDNGYDTLTTRAYVDKWEKISIIPFSWYRTQDISRSIPLPGDKEIPNLEEPAP